MKVATTGVKVATQVGKIATEVPAAAGPALAKAAQAAANPSALMKAQEAKLGKLAQAGGGNELEGLSFSDKMIGGGVAGILVGGFLLMMGRSYNETVFHFNGPTDLPMAPS